MVLFLNVAQSPNKQGRELAVLCMNQEIQMISWSLFNLIPYSKFYNLYQQQAVIQKWNSEGNHLIGVTLEIWRTQTVKEGAKPSCAKWSRKYRYNSSLHSRPTVEKWWKSRKISLYSDCLAPAWSDSPTQTESAAKTELLRNMAMPQMLTYSQTGGTFLACSSNNPTQTAHLSTKWNHQ